MKGMFFWVRADIPPFGCALLPEFHSVSSACSRLQSSPGYAALRFATVLRLHICTRL